MKPLLSVVVPALDEELRIGECLDAIARAADVNSLEVIVADGGSKDATRSVTARRPWARWLPAPLHPPPPAGRGRQLNAGARAARADRLFFLHADCTVGPGFLERIIEVTGPDGSREIRAGAFAMRIESPNLALALVSAMSNARFGITGIPYGDQGLFMTRAAFDATGGFPEWPLMEDIGMARALGRITPLTRIKDPHLGVCARRWEMDGLARTVVRHWLLAAAYMAGFQPSSLRRFYPDRRERIKSG